MRTRLFQIVFTFLLAAALLLSGCAHSRLDIEDEASAKHYVELLQQKKFDEIKVGLTPSLDMPDMANKLAELAELFPAQQPLSIKEVGFQSFRSDTVSNRSITLEYEYPGNKWIVANVVLQELKGSDYLTGLHVLVYPESLEQRTRFTLKGKDWFYCFFLTLMVFSTTVSLYAFVLCLRTRIYKRKWLWAISTLVGIGDVSMNWMTGAIDYRIFFVHLIPAAFQRQAYAPWIVSVSLPIGALYFLWNRLRIEAREGEPSSPTLPEPSAR